MKQKCKNMQLIENRISLLLLTYPCQEHSVIYSCNLQRWKAFDVRRRQSKRQRRCEEELKHIWVSRWGLWGQKSRGDDGWDAVVVGWKPVSEHSLSSQTHKPHGQQQKEDECARQEDESEGSWKKGETLKEGGPRVYSQCHDMFVMFLCGAISHLNGK